MSPRAGSPLSARLEPRFGTRTVDSTRVRGAGNLTLPPHRTKLTSIPPPLCFQAHPPRATRLSAHGPSFDPFSFAEPGASSFVDRHEDAAGARNDFADASAPVLALAALALAGAPGDAVAKGGEYGLGEGRIVSLAHPVVMGVCFLVSLGAAYTGLQWRRIRELQGEVGGLKTALKAPEAALALLEALEAPSPAEQARAAALRAEVAELSSEAAAKAAQRKDLMAMDYRDRHWSLGSVLLGLGVCFAIEGPVNTYMRAGKLFPGPHVYAGCACVCAWALAAALVPQMQKGKNWARSGHIGLNFGATALFAYYQIPTGLEIAAKVIEKTKFP